MSAEDVVRELTHFGTERCDRPDKHTGLDGHVQRTIDVHDLERLLPEITMQLDTSTNGSAFIVAQLPLALEAENVAHHAVGYLN